MTTDFSVWQLVAEASIVVQCILGLLLAASITSWAIIFRKRRVLSKAQAAADAFEKRFWSGGDLSAIYREVSANGDDKPGMETVFEAGFREFSRLRKQDADTGFVLEGARRAMRVSQVREFDRLEENLSFLATVGSTSPYVGLFGTVWGIMSAFQALGNVHAATIAMVAPGISEALIATAMGLIAAIPAVVAYNRFSNQVERLETRFDTFVDEFSSILQRHVPARSAA
ncbi:MAG TPA: protein TolQ [Gammaproteobacteria bacterium]|nr:protein TolQ [Gammaproteobacteria bacterium]HET8552057.1 protein TolQ [Gammaproteobacteria bacterium]